MSANSTQHHFLDEVRKRLPPHIAFADDLAEILSISRDSAYRRIRGETVLSLDEVSALSKHYRISLDQIISQDSEMVSFHNRFVTSDNFNFEKWLHSIESNLDMLAGFPEREMIISAKDIPIFYYFDQPEISAFKMFFWMKTVLRYEDFQEEKFRPEVVSNSLLALGRRIHDKFTSLARTELWSDDTIHASMRQIEFYNDCGHFHNAQLARALCDQLLGITRRIRDCAAAGKTEIGGESYNLYKNEILIADNTILFKMGERRQAFINHNTLNVLSTTHASFCRQTEDYLNNLLYKGTRISGSGEKERSRFFNKIEEKILALKSRIL